MSLLQRVCSAVQCSAVQCSRREDEVAVRLGLPRPATAANAGPAVQGARCCTVCTALHSV
jgi:hypothetical protein